VCALKASGEVEIWMYSLVTLALDRGEWSASAHVCCAPGLRAPVTHQIRGWVSSRMMQYE